MTALPSPDRFGAELEVAVRRDLGARRRRRRLLRATALAGAAAAVALGILAVLPGGGSSVVGPAAAALEARHTILHMELRGEQHNPDGSVVTWRSESWQLNEARSRGVRLSSARGDSRRVPLPRRHERALRRGEEHDLHRHSAGAPGRQPAQDQDRLEGPAGAADAQPGPPRRSRSGRAAATPPSRPRKAPSASGSSAPGHGIRTPMGRRRSRSGPRSSLPRLGTRRGDRTRRGRRGDAIRIESPTGGTHISSMPRATRRSSGRAEGDGGSVTPASRSTRS